jgi:hypothetical protein
MPRQLPSSAPAAFKNAEFLAHTRSFLLPTPRSKNRTGSSHTDSPHGFVIQRFRESPRIPCPRGGTAQRQAHRSCFDIPSTSIPSSHPNPPSALLPGRFAARARRLGHHSFWGAGNGDEDMSLRLDVLPGLCCSGLNGGRRRAGHTRAETRWAQGSGRELFIAVDRDAIARLRLLACASRDLPA